MLWVIPGLALGILPALAGADGDKPIKAVILAGQSNIVGKANAKDLPKEFQDPPENVLLFQNGSWGPLKPGEQFGPEISLGFALAKAWPQETFGLVKVAFGGTSMRDWDPSPEAAEKKSKKSGLYAKLIKECTQAGSVKRLEWTAFAWGQGLGDTKIAGLAEHRAESLEELVAAIRRDLKKPDLPFIMSQMHASVGANEAGDLVRKGNEEAVKKVPHLVLIPTEGLTFLSDKIHYDATGQIEYGQRYARAILECVKPASK